MKNDSVEKFSAGGLRTLVYATKQLSSELSDDEVREMSDSELESGLSLIGVTGLADRLQENVKECIQDFIDAEIKVWIVTGDKGSTAKSIGYSCGILSEDRELIEVQIDAEMSLQTKRSLLNGIVNSSDQQKDIMISGTSLQQLIVAVEEEKSGLQRRLMVNAFLCAKGFVVYRASPKQKAALVKFVR